MIDNGKGQRKLSLDIDIDVLADIKARAAFRHTSMRNYILEAVAMRMLRETEYNESLKRAKE